ncbi:MAG: hypothetical protein ACLPXB_04395 [Thiobacillaceae bacterium]
MVDPLLLNYLGEGTGIIGAITGTAGAMMGYVSYRHSEQIKALDLRLELRKAENTLRSIIRDLPTLLDDAKDSRINISAVTGVQGSRTFAQWMENWEADNVTIESLIDKLLDRNEDYDGLSSADLESRLVAAHSIELMATELRQKYQATLLADDEKRKEVRPIIRALTQGNLEGMR